MPRKIREEIVVAQSQFVRFESAGPSPVGDRNLGMRCKIGEHPRFSRPSGFDVSQRFVEMPSLADRRVVVTFSASLGGRIRGASGFLWFSVVTERRRRRNDPALHIVQRKIMHVRKPALCLQILRSRGTELKHHHRAQRNPYWCSVFRDSILVYPTRFSLHNSWPFDNLIWPAPVA